MGDKPIFFKVRVEGKMMQSEIREMVANALAQAGYRLWWLQCVSERQRTALRVFVDSEQGVTAEHCVTLARRLMIVLGAAGIHKERYAIEVSSPGIERSLCERDHFLRYIGSEVRVKTRVLYDGQRQWTGKLVSVSEEAIVLELDEKQVTLAFPHIEKANLVVFER